MTRSQTTVLVTLTGRDRPGVTSRLFASLAAHDLTVLDVEQVVIRGHLVLGVLLGLPGIARSDLDPPPVELARRRPRHGRRDHARAPASSPAPRPAARHRARPPADRQASSPPSPAGSPPAAPISTGSAGWPTSPVTCIELAVSGADPAALRAGPGPRVRGAGCRRRRPARRAAPAGERLVVMDVDSTLHPGRGDRAARRAGRAARGRGRRGHRGRDARRARLREVAARSGWRCWPGWTPRRARRGAAELRLTPGARTLVRTLKRLGYRCGVVSGGFTQVTDGLPAELGLDFAPPTRWRSSTAGSPAGSPARSSTGRARRGAARGSRPRRACRCRQTVAIGDGANDLDMLAAAGLGIAFNAKPARARGGPHAVNVPYLDVVLYLLGITREEVEAADAADSALAGARR